MALGLTVWRLPPAAFWRLTPREIATALEGLKSRRFSPPERAALHALLERFPDEC